MKTAGSLVLILMGLFFFSCIREMETNYAAPDETSGVMQVVITEQQGEAIDKMETVRFFVFKNALGMPELELNERFDIPAVAPGQEEVSKFKITLEVSRKQSGSNHKVVVAVINEPTEMKQLLDGVNTYAQLHNLELQLSGFLNTNHTGVTTGKTLPMTGVAWSDKVYATAAEAESDPVPVRMERAVARVEIYIRKEAGVDMELSPGTKITLKNTCDEEFFIRHVEGGNQFGRIQTVTEGFTEKEWIQTTSETIPDASGGDGRLMCYFYTPERTCSAAGNADKLKLGFYLLSGTNETRTAELVLDTFYPEGGTTEQAVEAILRNNRYKVVATVEDHTVTMVVGVEVLEWNKEEVDTEFN